MEIITGYTGKPHVTAEQDRDINIGMFGSSSYVLEVGMQLKAEVSSNNEIKIRDGVLLHQGCAASIKKNTYDSLAIINGSQGMKRIDLIVARYEKNQDDRTEKITLKVLQGTPAETSPAVPAHTTGDIQAGDTVADMPLYQVVIDGLNITDLKKVFETIGNISQLAEENKKLSAALDYDPTQKTYYEDGWRLIYRYISKNQVYVLVEKTNQGETAAQMHAKILSSCPLKALFKQEIPVKMAVANTVVGYGGMEFNGNTVYLSSTAYNNPVTWHGYGIITVG